MPGRQKIRAVFDRTEAGAYFWGTFDTETILAMLPPVQPQPSSPETPTQDVPKTTGFQAFVPSANTTVLNKADMLELKGGRRAAPVQRLFTHYFSWNSCCGGPMPQ